MTKKNINITLDNLTEWLCSTGYLFPRNEIELSRLERLHPEVERQTKDDSVDPFTILGGLRQRNPIKLKIEDEHEESFPEMRMAARKYQPLPERILNKIKQNQKKSNSNDKPED